MTLQAQPLFFKDGLPSVASADCVRHLIQAFALLDSRQPRKLGVERMLRMEKRFFSMQNWRVSPVPVIMEADLERLEMHGE